jgi:hypothetical protein
MITALIATLHGHLKRRRAEKECEHMARGGKREGAGRPVGSGAGETQNWVALGSTISPEAMVFLDSMKDAGHEKNKLLDRWILAAKRRFEATGEID